MSVLLLAAFIQSGPFDVKEVALDRAATRAMIERYGDCIVKNRRKAAAEVILKDVYSPVIRVKYPTLFDGECLDAPRALIARLALSGEQLKYALADALFERELAGRAAPSVAAVPPLPRDPPYPPPVPPPANANNSTVTSYREAERSYNLWRITDVASRFGECVVRTNPPYVRELLKTEPETAEESAAFRMLGGAFGQCLATGQKLTFSKQVLRGTVAVNYYRLDHASRRAMPEAAE